MKKALILHKFFTKQEIFNIFNDLQNVSCNKQCYLFKEQIVFLCNALTVKSKVLFDRIDPYEVNLSLHYKIENFKKLNQIASSYNHHINYKIILPELTDKYDEEVHLFLLKYDDNYLYLGMSEYIIDLNVNNEYVYINLLFELKDKLSKTLFVELDGYRQWRLDVYAIKEEQYIIAHEPEIIDKIYYLDSKKLIELTLKLLMEELTASIEITRWENDCMLINMWGYTMISYFPNKKLKNLYYRAVNYHPINSLKNYCQLVNNEPYIVINTPVGGEEEPLKYVFTSKDAIKIIDFFIKNGKIPNFITWEIFDNK